MAAGCGSWRGVLADDPQPQPSRHDSPGGIESSTATTPAKATVCDDASRTAAEIARLREELAGQMRTNDVLRMENETLRRAASREAADPAAPAAQPIPEPASPQPDAAELAARKAQAAEFLALVKAATTAHDKAGALKALEALKSAGAGTEQEYLAALKAIVAIGQPEKSPDGNALGLSWDEYRRMLSREMRDALMRDPTQAADCPDLLRLAASLYRRDVFVPKEQQAEMLVGLLDKSTVPEVQLSAIRHLEGLEGREVLAGLSRFATSAAYSTELRENAVESIKSLAEKHDSDALNTLRSLQRDADPRVSARARLGVLEADPPVSGYLVDAVFPEYQGARIGLKIEDIIVTINGRAVRNDELRALQLTIPESGTGIIEVHRDGQTLQFTVDRGALGIDGGFVEKK